MTNYEIKINVVRLLHYSNPSKSKVNNETLLMLIKSFSFYIKSMYVTMIYDSIHANRYKGRWEPIDDPGYIDYLGTEPSVDIFELMYDALEVRNIKQNIVIRFNPLYKYPESKHTLVTVLNAIDNGTTKFNARPLLKYIARQIRSDIPTLWRIYLKRKGVT